jgi:hypothetical protein
MTCSRSSPRSDRARSRCSSASRNNASSDERQAAGSAWSTASCSGVASPSTSASTYMSNCHGASGVGVGVCVTDLRWIRRRAQRASSKSAGPRTRPVPVAPCGGPKLGNRPLRVDGNVDNVHRRNNRSKQCTTFPEATRTRPRVAVPARTCYSALARVPYSNRAGNPRPSDRQLRVRRGTMRFSLLVGGKEILALIEQLDRTTRDRTQHE